MCIDASAVDTVVKMEASSGRSFFGDSITFSYKHNDILYSSTLQYAGNISATYRGSNIDSNSIMDSQVSVNSYDCIMYKASTNAGQFGFLHDVVIDCPVYYSGYARGGFGMSSPVSTSNVTDVSNSIIQYPNNYVGQFSGICANTQASASFVDYYAVITTDDYQGYAWSWRPLLYEVNDGAFFEEICFDHVLCNYYGDIYFCIWLPYVGGSMTDRPPQTTTTTATSSGGAVTTGDINVDVNVDVDVDMEETNGLLSDLIDTVIDVGVSIVSGVGDLFLPDDDYIENWVDDMSELVVDAFSDNVHEDTLKDILLDIGTYGATDSIRFPAVTVGDTTIIPSTSVSLVPFGRDIMVHVETAINLVCTMWVLNMVMNRIKGVILGEKVVDIEGDDVE